jgi:signal transduction histidine kinase
MTIENERVHDHVDRIAALPVFASVPRAELDWLGSRGHAFGVGAGDRLRELGEPLDDMWIVLTGQIAAYVPKEGGSWRKFMEVDPGYVIGAMPYSRASLAVVRIVAHDDTLVFALHRSHFPDLVRQCPELTAVLVHHMIDRARDYRSAQIHDDRMQSLGRLAAGLAHELNNPASGATSHARSLAPLLNELLTASTALARARLSDEQIEAIDVVRRTCLDVVRTHSALELADREDEFVDWLARHDADPSAASTLAPTNINIATLDRLATTVPSHTLGAAIRWAASDAAVRQAAGQIMTATGRIHDLVSAVKGFTFMDREGVPEDVDIARGLADTVAMLERKAGAKSVRVRIETASDLPRVHGFGSELNQVWEKLIDNAIDAARAGGSVTVTATTRSGYVVVRVADDGHGIPEQDRTRIFDPFFTTKPVGSGTGLGLDIARRFVQLNDGDLDFTSQPGHTVFRVQLPAANKRQ